MRAVLVLLGAALLLAAAVPARATDLSVAEAEADAEAEEALDALDIEAGDEAGDEDALDAEDDAEDEAEADDEDAADDEADEAEEAEEAFAEVEADAAGGPAKAPAKVAAPGKVTPQIVPKGALASTLSCQYVSAASVVANSALTGVKPPALNCAGAACSLYLAPGSALGVFGPIGSLGPLGALGPIGTNAWNPSAWKGAAGDWSQWSKSIAANSLNPLSAAGPMGTLATLQSSANDFMKHLSVQGVFTVLGPVGPLGALGPLGPLGPMGLHGFTRNAKTGAYQSGNAVQRTFTAAWDAKTQRTWELVEHYPSAAAANAVADQDSSFVAESTIAVGFAYAQTPDVIRFGSKSDQFITVLAVPENTLDSFHITVRRVGGAAVAASNEIYYVNYVQFRAAAGAKYEVSVTLGASTRVSPFGFSYRLVVTGSTPLGAAPFVSGPHVSKC